MKTIRLFICGALLLFIASASLSAQTNLIANGDFETLGGDGNPIGWLDYNSWDWTFPGTSSKVNVLSDTDVPDGIGSLKSGKFIFHDGPDENAYGTDYPMILTDKIPAGTTFDISFWIKGGPKVNTTSDNYDVAIDAAMFENNAFLPKSYTAQTPLFEGEWFKLTYEGITSQTTAAQPWFALVLSIRNCQYVLLDDVKITLHETTTTNLIPNGNFEEVDANGKPTGWGDGFNEEVTALTAEYTSSNSTDFKEGARSGSFKHNPYWSTISARNWIKNIPANKTYNFSFWYKVSDKLDENGNEPTFNMEETTFYSGATAGNNYALLSAPLNAIPGEWFFGEVKGFQSLSVAEDLVVGFTTRNCTFLLDDVQMLETTETGITDVKADTKLPVYVSEGTLYVGGTTAGETVSVYNITGQTLKSEKAQSATTKITGLSRGQVYIVRCGGKSAKVVL